MYHDRKIERREFTVGGIVLFLDLWLKLFPDKLRSKWNGPHGVATVLSYGAVKMENKDGKNFKVNVQRMKHYLGEVEEVKVVCDVDLDGA